MANRFVGLVAAPHTAMNPDGTLNLPLVEKQVRCLVANDIAGAFVCGSTGEGISLTTDERMRLGLRWKEALAGSMPLIIQVGHHSIAEARTLAEHAERKIAADAIASIAPSYFKPRRLEELVSFCAEVAAAAPATPFYYYHQPGNSGVDLPMARFLELAAPRIPTLAGLKFSHGDLMDFGRCLDFEAGRFDVLFGQDETLLAALALGARGSMSCSARMRRCWRPWPWGPEAPLAARTTSPPRCSTISSRRSRPARSTLPAPGRPGPGSLSRSWPTSAACRR